MSTPTTGEVVWSGLDLTRPDSITQDEIDAFHGHYMATKGELLAGHEFLLEFRPDVLKRYAGGPNELGIAPDCVAAVSLGSIHEYAIGRWDDGLRQHLQWCRNMGVPKAEVLDVLSVANLLAGPRGMDHVASTMTPLLRDYGDPEPQPHFPASWSFDPEAFSSGMDFSDPDLSDKDLDALRDWYTRTIGTVPNYVDFLARFRPRLLKAYRNRWEHALVGGLPKQMVPFLQIQRNTYLGFRDGIRESALLGRAFGMTRDELLTPILFCYMYGGIHALNIAGEATADILAAMD